MKLLLDHQLTAAAAAPELPLDLPGAYETLWWRQGDPVFWDDHWERFGLALRHYGLAAPWTGRQLRQAADELAAANGIQNGVLRYMVWREEDQGSVSQATHSRIDVTPPRPHMAKAAFELTWSPKTVTAGVAGSTSSPSARDSDLHRFKHLSRGAWRDATQHARSANFDDALVADAAGAVLEAGTSNVFLVMGSELHTPTLEAHPLPGVMRQHVIQVAGDAGITVHERRCTRDDVEAADAIWLSNSLIGIRPVKRLDNRAYQLEVPLLGRLRDTWRARYGWDPVVLI